MKNNTIIAKYLRYITRTVLIYIAGFWFIFALLSGSEPSKGLLQNLPNTLPWLLLFVIVYIAWKWEFAGSLLIISGGLFTIFFFHTYNSLPAFIMISLPLIVFGTSLFAAAYLSAHSKD